MPKKTTMRDVGQAAEALGRNTFRVFFRPDQDKRPVEKQPILMEDLDDPKAGPKPETKTPKAPDFYYKAYGAYAPRYTNGRKVSKKKTGKRKKGSK